MSSFRYTIVPRSPLAGSTYQMRRSRSTSCAGRAHQLCRAVVRSSPARGSARGSSGSFIRPSCSSWCSSARRRRAGVVGHAARPSLRRGRERRCHRAASRRASRPGRDRRAAGAHARCRTVWALTPPAATRRSPAGSLHASAPSVTGSGIDAPRRAGASARRLYPGRPLRSRRYRTTSRARPCRRSAFGCFADAITCSRRKSFRR
jgi:hypothetical protein